MQYSSSVIYILYCNHSFLGLLGLDLDIRESKEYLCDVVLCLVIIFTKSLFLMWLHKVTVMFFFVMGVWFSTLTQASVPMNQTRKCERTKAQKSISMCGRYSVPNHRNLPLVTRL